MQNDFNISSTDSLEEIKLSLKKAKTADGISVALYKDELFFVFHRNGKPMGKVLVSSALTAYDIFIDGIESSTQNHH